MQIDTRNIYQADVTTNILHRITNSQESRHTTLTYNIHFWRIYIKEQITAKIPNTHKFNVNEIEKFLRNNIISTQIRVYGVAVS